MKRVRRLPAAPANLNLVPLLDMVSLLIQLMLVNVEFDSLVQVPSAIGSPAGESAAGLQFFVDVTTTGYQATWRDGGGQQTEAIPCQGQCTAATYDKKALAAVAARVHAVDASDKQVVVRPGRSVPLEAVLGAMDAVRGPALDRFTDVVIGDGP